MRAHRRPRLEREREVEPGAPSCPALRQVDRADAERALVAVVDDRAVGALVAPAVPGVDAALAPQHVVLVAPLDTFGVVDRRARPPAPNTCVDAAQLVGHGQVESNRPTVDAQRERRRRRPAVRPVGAGDRQPQPMAGHERPRRRFQLDGRRPSTRRGRAAPAARPPRPSPSAGQQPRCVQVEHAAGDQRGRAVGRDVAQLHRHVPDRRPTSAPASTPSPLPSSIGSVRVLQS